MAEHIAGQLHSGLRAAALIVLGVIHLGLALPVLLSQLYMYPHPWLQLAGHAVLTLVAACSILREVTRRGPSPGWLLSGLFCTLASSVVVTGQLPAEAFLSTPHWSMLVVGWFGVVLLIERPLSEIWIFLGCHLAVTIFQLALAGFPSRSAAAGMAVSGMIIFGFQIAVAVAANLLRARAALVSHAMAEEEEARTRALLAAQLHSDQRERYRRLGSTVFPLLAGLADGSQDAQDDDVRRRCALEAARMRRLFAESDHVSDQLGHELRAGIDVAERQGVSVQLAFRGDPVAVPRQLRRALIEPVIAALTVAERTARATVVRGGGRVRVGVVIDVPEAPLPEVTTPGVRMRVLPGEGRLWVETSCSLYNSSSETRPS